MSIDRQEAKEATRPATDPTRFLGIPIPIWLVTLPLISGYVGSHFGHQSGESAGLERGESIGVEKGKVATPDNQKNLNTTIGEITMPRNGRAVDNDNANYEFECQGTVEGLIPGLHLWLATERHGYLWPKNGEFKPYDSKNWSQKISEKGDVDKPFTVTLFVANDEANQAIKDWLRAGDETGQYAQLEWIRGINRLDRVDRLRTTRQP